MSTEVGPLIAKAFKGQTKIVSRDGRTFLESKCVAHAEIVEDPDDFVNALDTDGINCVHGCALNGFLSTLEVLVQYGADPLQKTFDGIDALQIARSRGHHDITAYLENIEPVLRAVAERKAAEEQARLDLIARREAANQARREEMQAKMRAEEKARQMKADAKAAALKKAQLEAKAREEAARGIDPMERVIWAQERIDIDTRRHIGFFPRRPP